MTASDLIALGGAALTLGVNVAGYLVAYGALQATVQGLAGRVGALEREITGLAAMKIELARIGERQDLWIDQLRDLNAAIRWMREPEGDGPAGRPVKR